MESCEEESVEEDEADGLEMEKDGGVRAEVHFEFCNDTEEKGRNIVIPVVGTGKDREKLVRETKEDSTLETIQTFSDNKDKGYKWEDGLLVQAIISQNLDEKLLIVLPKSFRKQVLKLAHEGLGHVGSKTVRAIIKINFTWPGVGADVINVCTICEICQRCNKHNARKAPMVERQVMTETFEAMAFDLVGPLPKAKGGFRFILTTTCQASRQPEAFLLSQSQQKL